LAYDSANSFLAADMDNDTSDSPKPTVHTWNCSLTHSLTAQSQRVAVVSQLQPLL